MLCLEQFAFEVDEAVGGDARVLLGRNEGGSVGELSIAEEGLVGQSSDSPCNVGDHYYLSTDNSLYFMSKSIITASFSSLRCRLAALAFTLLISN